MLKAALKTSCPEAIPEICTVRLFLPCEARKTCPCFAQLVHREPNVQDMVDVRNAS